MVIITLVISAFCLVYVTSTPSLGQWSVCPAFLIPSKCPLHSQLSCTCWSSVRAGYTRFTSCSSGVARWSVGSQGGGVALRIVIRKRLPLLLPLVMEMAQRRATGQVSVSVRGWIRAYSQPFQCPITDIDDASLLPGRCWLKLLSVALAWAHVHIKVSQSLPFDHLTWARC